MPLLVVEVGIARGFRETVVVWPRATFDYLLRHVIEDFAAYRLVGFEACTAPFQGEIKAYRLLYCCSAI